MINAPKRKFKVFGSKAQSTKYMPVAFGTDRMVTVSNWSDIANANFEYGLESLQGDLQLRDLNSVLFYLGRAIGYLYQQGIPEWSKYENYVVGSVVSHEGTLYIAQRASFGKPEPKEPKYDACGNICTPVPTCEDTCEVEVKSPKDNPDWCALVTACEYKAKVKELEEVNTALQDSINNLKGVEAFSFNPATGNFELQLSDGTTKTAAHNATVELRNFDGSYTVGFAHATPTGG